MISFIVCFIKTCLALDFGLNGWIIAHMIFGFACETEISMPNAHALVRTSTLMEESACDQGSRGLLSPFKQIFPEKAF